MSERKAVRTDKAPPPRPVYNQAVVANGLIFCSGQLPKDASGKAVEGTTQDRARQCILNLQAVLEAGGSCLDNVAEVNVFLSDIADFDQVNEVYLQYFGDLKPARTCVAVKTIPGNFDVEMKCIGVVKKENL